MTIKLCLWNPSILRGFCCPFNKGLKQHSWRFMDDRKRRQKLLEKVSGPVSNALMPPWSSWLSIAYRLEKATPPEGQTRSTQANLRWAEVCLRGSSLSAFPAWRLAFTIEVVRFADIRVVGLFISSWWHKEANYKNDSDAKYSAPSKSFAGKKRLPAEADSSSLISWYISFGLYHRLCILILTNIYF